MPYWSYGAMTNTAGPDQYYFYDFLDLMALSLYGLNVHSATKDFSSQNYPSIYVSHKILKTLGHYGLRSPDIELIPRFQKPQFSCASGKQHVSDCA
ncbi:unnamed protein product, partial [Dicrocoelium dendriticum]